MKRLLGICLVLMVVLGVCGSAEAEGILFLRDAEIVFSVIGESADIYGGSIPVEDVLWESSNPDAICVENGVVSAVGVGSAVVKASCGEQVLTCDVSCLAKNREALLQKSIHTLQAPHRIAAEVDIDPTAFFADAAIVGDSVTYSMYVNETASGLLGHPLFLARKNVGVHNFYNHIINLYYQGTEYYVEDAIAASGVKKAFFLLGMNDVGYQTPTEIIEKYSTVIDRIRAKSPDVEIYLQTCLPCYSNTLFFPGMNNRIDEYNAKMRTLAQEKGCHIVELADYIKDSVNNMATEYCSDFEVHMNEAGSAAWMKVLRAYAYEQMIK